MKITMQHIIESDREYCHICKKYKAGKFTIFYVERHEEKWYFGVCRECLQ